MNLQLDSHLRRDCPLALRYAGALLLQRVVSLRFGQAFGSSFTAVNIQLVPQEDAHRHPKQSLLRVCKYLQNRSWQEGPTSSRDSRVEFSTVQYSLVQYSII